MLVVIWLVMCGFFYMEGWGCYFWVMVEGFGFILWYVFVFCLFEFGVCIVFGFILCDIENDG